MRTSLLGLTIAMLAGCQASVQAHASASGEGSPACENAGADLGAPPAAKGNSETVTLRCGTYHGDLVVHGNDMRVSGAGRGQTIIDGRLEVHGNHAHVGGMTVKGVTEVHGNDNDVGGVETAGGLSAHGNDNSN